MFLKILAITGIVLLCAAAFVIAALLLVLLVPVRYKVSADSSGTAAEGSARAGWLFGFASAKAGFKDSKITYSVKILFFTLLKGEIGADVKKEEKKAYEIRTGKEETDRQDLTEGTGPERKIPEKGKKRSLKTRQADSEPKQAAEPGKTHISLSEWAGPIIKKIFKNAERQKDRFLKVYKKIKNIFEKIKKAKYIWDAPVTKRALKSVKIKLSGLLNHIKPKKIKGELTIGFEDPAQTASAYAIAGIISGSIGAEIVITPDFEEQKFEIKNLYVSGRIFIGYVVILALKLLTDKDVRRVVNYIRRNF